MKKNYTLFILLLLIGTSFGNAKQTTEQSRQKIRKIVTNQLLSGQIVNHQENFSGRKKMKPFETMLPDSAILYSSKEESLKYLFSYDEEKRLVTEMYERLYSIDVPEWTHGIIWPEFPSSKNVVEYDAEGRVITAIAYESDWINGELTLTSKNIIEYHKGYKISSQAEYDYYSEDAWEAFKVEVDYDNEDYITKGRWYVCDSENEEWEWVEEFKTEYTIESDGKIAYEISFRDVEEGDTDFWLESKVIVGYDENGYEIYTENQYWDEDSKVFIPEEREIRAYNAAGKLTLEEYYTYSYQQREFVLFTREAHIYNEKNNIAQSDIWVMDVQEPRGTIIYFYEGINKVGEEKGSPVNVRLHGNVLFVSSDQAEKVSVISVSGIETTSFHKEVGEFSRDINLPGGVYIVKGSSGWTKKIAAW